MKTIAIKVGATPDAPIDVNIEPGTTSSDILAHIKETKNKDLTGYALSKVNGGNQFHLMENIYPKVEDGEKLMAFHFSTVAC
jgi:hypothetical protein